MATSSEPAAYGKGNNVCFIATGDQKTLETIVILDTVGVVDISTTGETYKDTVLNKMPQQTCKL